MAPYFEQYRQALQRSVNNTLIQETKTIGNAQNEIVRLTQTISDAQKQIDNLNHAITEREGRITQIHQTASVFDNPEEVDIFVLGHPNGPVNLSMFAQQATQDRIQATTPDEQTLADNKLQSIFSINEALKQAGIDTERQISLDVDNVVSVLNSDPPTNQEIEMDGEKIMLSSRELDVYRILQQNEARTLNMRDIAQQANLTIQQIGSIIYSLRRKIESDPQKPQHIVGRRGGYGVGGITFRRNLPDSKQ